MDAILAPLPMAGERFVKKQKGQEIKLIILLFLWFN